MKIPQIKIPAVWFTLMIAVYFTAILNMTFWREGIKIISGIDDVKIGFLISVPFLLVAAFNVLFSPFSIKFFEKFFFSFLILLSAVVNYATFTYGIYMNTEMIQNTLETNTAEAGSYVNMSLILWLLLTGLLPVLGFFVIKIEHPPLLKDILLKCLSVAISLGIIGIIWVLYYVDYAAIGRNHKGIEKRLVPTYVIHSTVKYIKSAYFTRTMPFEHKGMDAKYFDRSPHSPKKDLMIVVIGETARSMNYELNGYNRPTNAYTRDLGILSYQKATSCGTETAVSVPCIFSMLGHNRYDHHIFENSDNITDVVAHAGIQQLWMENDGGSKGVAVRIPLITLDIKTKSVCDGDTCYDTAFLPLVQKSIDSLNDESGILYLHIIGSHGPTYFERYPRDHAKFLPDCQQSDIQNCSHESIVNTYDNTILFTDFVLSEIIGILEKNTDQYNPALLYVSDHGESLGENGVYLHAMPYAIAPKEQTHIPMMWWIPPVTASDKLIDLSCLKDHTQSQAVSHDFISHTILGYMDIQTSAYEPKQDLLTPCRK